MGFGRRAGRLGRAALLVTVLAAAAIARAETACSAIDGNGTQTCVSGLTPSTLASMQQVQRGRNWCWAAVVSMVLRRYGVQVEQEDVVRTRWGTLDDERVALQDLTALLNRSWSDSAGRTARASALELPRWRRAHGITAPEVVEELDGGRPVVIGTRQHASLLVQLVYERDARTGQPQRLLRAVVLDPASPVGIRTATAAEVAADFIGLVHVEVQQDNLRRL